MPSTGRQKASSPWNIFLALLFFFTSSASAAVLGLDFGTLNLKASLVKPGIPLEIVLTKDSKRKEAAAVAFKPTRDSSNNVIAELGSYPERAYGGDALALQGRMPGEVFPNLKPLLGLSWNGEQSEAVNLYTSRYPAVQAKQDGKLGTTLFTCSAFNKAEEPWSVEELLAMELGNIKNNAEGMAGNMVEDTVITIPAFYTADEKRAIEKAADLAGLNVMGLISDGLAVGLDYAKSRTFPTVNDGGKPEQHIIFDMGAGSTTATVLRFQSRKVKDVGKYNKTVQEVAVLGTGWDRTLGGDSFNQVIVDDYIRKFVTKPVMKSRGIGEEDVSKNGRLMGRVWKDAEKTRHVLSANSDANSFFEELLPEIDFKTKLTRADFEALTTEFADRVAGPLKDALAAAKLTIADIDSVILHGGAVRTPFVQRKLEEFVGKSEKLRSNVNADESAVFGAAFKAAGLSPSFKVKEIRDSDVAGYPAGITYIDGGKDRRQSLFTATSPIGNNASTKQVSFKHKEDFDFALYQQVGDVDQAIAQVQTTNLTASVAALKEKFGCEKDDVSTKFSIRLSAVDGIPEVVSGSVSCETDQAAKGSSVGDSVKGWLGFGKKDQEPLESEDGTETTEQVEASTSSSSSSASASSSAVPEKPKKRIETITVAFMTTPKGLPQTTPEEIKRMRERLVAFDRSDKARYAREEALNVLEAFTYHVRDFLDNSDYSPVSTSGQRSEISKLLDETKEWMEEPKEIAKATEKVFKERLSALKKLVEPIKQRRTESEGRDDKVSALKSSLEQTNKLMDTVREQVKKAEEESSKIASSIASASTTTASTDTDDLEDDDDEATSTSSAKSTPTPSVFSPYTNDDLTSISKIHSEVSAWLAEKTVAQGKLTPHEDPVLTIKDLEAKASRLSEAMLELIQKKIRQPKPSSSSSSSKKSKSKASKTKKNKSSSSTSTSTSSANEEVETEAPEPAEESAGGPKIVNMEAEHGRMPTEEEVLRMLKAMGDGKKDEEEEGHDEL
jgi:hypoxia up-regulated 1